MNSHETLPRQPLTPDESGEMLAVRWMFEKMLHAQRLNPLDVDSTYVEFLGHTPMTNLDPAVSSDSALIEFIRNTARENNCSSVFVVRPTIVEPDGKRGIFCYAEVMFGKAQHTTYKMYDGEGWSEIEEDKQPLGRLLYGPGEPMPR